jgi:hypothetical protein
MGSTIPSFRIASVMEQNEWKAFRKCLGKLDRKVRKTCCMRGIPSRAFVLFLLISTTYLLRLLTYFAHGNRWNQGSKDGINRYQGNNSYSQVCSIL